jgi:hypothetical protein
VISTRIAEAREWWRRENCGDAREWSDGARTEAFDVDLKEGDLGGGLHAQSRSKDSDAHVTAQNPRLLIDYPLQSNAPHMGLRMRNLKMDVRLLQWRHNQR